MVLPFQLTGLLPLGIHTVTWRELESRSGFPPQRRRLLTGLRRALVLLKRASCQRVYLDGSFVTLKPQPGEIDVCRAIDGVEPDALDGVFLDFSQARAQQKARFVCEFFPVDLPKGLTGKTFSEFFQVDKCTGMPKAILTLSLRSWGHD